ncbi:MAG: hypothetical protein JSV09_05620 [Thermoplasmata archaeon]|nr:MAG: hypothetical protein JSV09_05620 [Thermoplasmata archaeon]
MSIFLNPMITLFIVSNQIIIPKNNKDNDEVLRLQIWRICMSQMGFDYSNSQNKPLNSNINRVISDLKEGSDIEGVVLVEGRDKIIECNMPYEKFCKVEIPELIDTLESRNRLSFNHNHNGILEQYVIDYNEYKVLAKKLENDLTLLVLLQNRGYVSLAMLDIEISTRRISEILNRFNQKIYP